MSRPPAEPIQPLTSTRPPRGRPRRSLARTDGIGGRSDAVGVSRPILRGHGSTPVVSTQPLDDGWKDDQGILLGRFLGGIRSAGYEPAASCAGPAKRRIDKEVDRAGSGASPAPPDFAETAIPFDSAGVLRRSRTVRRSFNHNVRKRPITVCHRTLWRFQGTAQRGNPRPTPSLQNTNSRTPRRCCPAVAGYPTSRATRRPGLSDGRGYPTVQVSPATSSSPRSSSDPAVVLNRSPRP